MIQSERSAQYPPARPFSGKKTGAILLIFCTCLIGSAAVRASSDPPDWFLHLPAKQDEVIGYGVAATLEQATLKAKQDIAQTLQTRILSESVDEQRLHRGEYSQDIRTRVREQTDVIISEVVSLRKEHRDGHWYVALKYENLPLWKKVGKKRGDRPCRQDKQNRYLRRTPLVVSLNEALKCALDYRVARRHGLWHLDFDEGTVALSPLDFEKLMVPCEAIAIALLSSKSRLVEGEAFSFRLQPNQDGYASLFNVYENGEVFVLLSNRPARERKEIVFPESSENKELFAGLAEPGRPAYDMYVAVLTDKEISFTRFQEAGNKVERGEIHFKFDELLELMNRYPFATVLLRTKPR